MTGPLSQDEILAQLKTRGFEDGFQATPLRDFWGKMTDYSGEMKAGNYGDYLVVQYNLDSIEVIDSVEPYTSPIAQIQISHSNKLKSKAGYWGASVDKVINADVPLDEPLDSPKIRNQDYLIGKMCHLKLTPGHMIYNATDKVEKPTDCWVLLEVRDGAPTTASAGTPAATGESPTQAALRLLDGRTEQQWHQEVFANASVKGSPDTINAIIGRTFLAPFEALGTVTKDAADVYHVTS